MPFRKKVLYYGLMLFLTLLALEGMARLAYYAAYGQGYGGGPDAPGDSISPPPTIARELAPPTIPHPLYGFTDSSMGHALNALPPTQRRAGTAVIGLFGGSVAEEVNPFLQRELSRYFAANGLARQPIVRALATNSIKQPQQVMILSHTLLLGGEFDLIVNLDGFNEASLTAAQSMETGVFPFLPYKWRSFVGLTTAELLRAGRIGVLRREQARLAAAGATSPLRRSAVFGLANRWRRERIAAEIIQRNHDLAATKSYYSLEKYGPRRWRETEEELLPEAARVWYRSSAALARLAEMAGAEYYHFRQPNQYVPGAKPLSPAELESAYNPHWYPAILAARGYPQLRAISRDLSSQGINYFDLTGIFVDHPETLYRDKCCHLNARGNELLAAAMVRRLEPALLRLGGETPAGPVSALTAARRPPEPDTLLFRGDFQVYRRGATRLRYVRENCTPADTEARFFLHLTPRDLTDLPPPRREADFDNRDFSFAEVGGRFWQGQCMLLFPLPGYPIAQLRTGQYAPGAGELWSGEFAFRE